MKKIKCQGSQMQRHVSDGNVIDRMATCPFCNLKVKITIPDRRMHCNTAKFSNHSIAKE